MPFSPEGAINISLWPPVKIHPFQRIVGTNIIGRDDDSSSKIKTCCLKVWYCTSQRFTGNSASCRVPGSMQDTLCLCYAYAKLKTNYGLA
ncbi:MAG: hypothetical protein WBJ30_00725 [Tepidanaerobacteraceae bacterium]|nr:hypothetical protein [Tepidanaerobacter sp.]HQE04715.1 hypothetical protein [Tepidanaerobacteraceae bacterium]